MSITGIRQIIVKWLWAKTQHLIWHTSASRDQLQELIRRLEMNESTCPPDTRAALHLARQLRRRIYE